MWIAEMKFGNDWVRLPGKWKSRDDAEWAIGTWKQANRMTSDPFRYTQTDAPTVNAELLAALEKIVDHNPSTCPGIMPQDCLETCQEIARAAIAKAKEKK